MLDDPNGNNAIPTDKWRTDLSTTISDTLTKVGIQVSPEQLADLKTAAEASPDLKNHIDGKWLFNELSRQGLNPTYEQRESLFRLSDPEFEITKKRTEEQPEEQKEDGANGPVGERLAKSLAQYNDPSYVPSTPVEGGSAPTTPAQPPRPRTNTP